MKRTIIKTVAYRLVATCELALVAWLVTGSLHMATGIGGAHMALSTFTYAGFDRLFDLFWGVR